MVKDSNRKMYMIKYFTSFLTLFLLSFCSCRFSAANDQQTQSLPNKLPDDSSKLANELSALSKSKIEVNRKFFVWMDTLTFYGCKCLDSGSNYKREFLIYLDIEPTNINQVEYFRYKFARVVNKYDTTNWKGRDYLSFRGDSLIFFRSNYFEEKAYTTSKGRKQKKAELFLVFGTTGTSFVSRAGLEFYSDSIKVSNVNNSYTNDLYAFEPIGFYKSEGKLKVMDAPAIDKLYASKKYGIINLLYHDSFGTFDCWMK